jgi:hypothetical protein
VAKDKKKKKDKKKSPAGSASSSLKTLSKNPIVADVVAAALVATASALKDSNKARRLAADAGDQLNALAKEGAERGNAMWQLALDIGRRAVETVSAEASKPVKSSKAPKRAKAAKRPVATRSAKGSKPAKSSKRTKRSKAKTKAD